MTLLLPDRCDFDLAVTEYEQPTRIENPKAKWSVRSSKVSRRKFQVKRRAQPEQPSKLPLAKPLERLMACQPPQIPELAANAMRWQSAQLPITRNRALERLAARINESRRGGYEEIKEVNCRAGIEFLATVQSHAASPLIERWLRARPVAEGHLYLLPLPRILEALPEDAALRMADHVAQILDDVVRKGELDTEWGRRLGVEAFRTLAVLSPKDGIERAARHVPLIGPLEISAVLEAVLQALERSKEAPSAKLVDAGNALWRRYSTHQVADADNVPGVLARAFELITRAGKPLDESLESLRGNQLLPSVLFLAVRQNLSYMNRQDQRRLYLAALTSLREAKQQSSYRRLHQSIPKELGITEEDLQ